VGRACQETFTKHAFSSISVSASNKNIYFFKGLDNSEAVIDFTILKGKYRTNATGHVNVNSSP